MWFLLGSGGIFSVFSKEMCMNSDRFLYTKAVILIGIIVFSITISIYYMDQYFYRKLHDFYLSDTCDSYDPCDEDVEMMIKKSVVLKKEHFKNI